VELRARHQSHCEFSWRSCHIAQSTAAPGCRRGTARLSLHPLPSGGYPPANRRGFERNLAGLESPHLVVGRQHRSTKERVVSPIEMAATGIVPQSRLRSGQRPVAVHRVHHVPDVRVLHVAIGAP
jgi:hypothetical protein